MSVSEVKTKKVSANFQINTDTDLYRNIIEPKSSARCLSEFVHDLLDIYNSDSQIRDLIDAKIDERNPLNQIKEQVLRVNSEHQKTIMSANILSSLIDFKGSGVFGSGIVGEGEEPINSKDIFEKDGVLEGLRSLLPEPVRQEIRAGIDNRVRALETKVESILKAMSNRGINGELPLGIDSGVSKVNQLVSNLESIYSVDSAVTNHIGVSSIVSEDSGIISEEVSIPKYKQEDELVVDKDIIIEKDSTEPVGSGVVLEDLNSVTIPNNASVGTQVNEVKNTDVVEDTTVSKPKARPKSFGKLMSSIKA